MDNKRYVYLDNLKWFLAILVIVFHSSITAISAQINPIGWNLPDVSKPMQWQYHILDTFISLCASFFMSLFFFISGYFVSPSLTRKGTARFITDKLKRLGTPILMTLFLVFPIVTTIIFHFLPYETTAHGISQLSYTIILKYFLAPLFETGNIDLGVTWFTWTLIIFSVFFSLSQRYFSSSNQENSTKKIPALWKMTLFAIIMAPINYLGLYLQHHLGNDFLGFHLLGYFPMYIAMFYFGIQAYKYNWLDQLELKHAFWGILVWILGQGFLRPIASGYGLNSEMLSRGFTVIGMCIFLLYAFKTLFNTQYRLTAMLSRTAFAAYVFQTIPLSLMAGVFRPYMTQTPIINFIVIAIPSVTLSFSIAFIVCKLPVLRRIF